MPSLMLKSDTIKNRLKKASSNNIFKTSYDNLTGSLLLKPNLYKRESFSQFNCTFNKRFLNGRARLYLRFFY
jgi:hypothetical protein